MATKMPSIGMSVISPVFHVLQLCAVDGGGQRGIVLRAEISSITVSHMKVDVLFVEQPLLQDLFGAQFVAPVNQRHRLGEIGEIKRFLDGRIAAADDDHVLAAIEETVAGRAGRNAKPMIFLLALDPEPFGLGAGGDDQRVACRPRRCRRRAERARVDFDLGDDVVDDFGADILRLLEHLFHHPRALHRLGIARIVLDLGRDHQLAALFHAGDSTGLSMRARGRSMAGGVAVRAVRKQCLPMIRQDCSATGG
jgi:hypothetical protein